MLNGVLVPVTVRPLEDGEYEMISVHSYIGTAENCNQSAYQGRVPGCWSGFSTPGNLCHFGIDQ